jgi:hypothetical protein
MFNMTCSPVLGLQVLCNLYQASLARWDGSCAAKGGVVKLEHVVSFQEGARGFVSRIVGLVNGPKDEAPQDVAAVAAAQHGLPSSLFADECHTMWHVPAFRS